MTRRRVRRKPNHGLDIVTILGAPALYREARRAAGRGNAATKKARRKVKHLVRGQ